MSRTDSTAGVPPAGIVANGWGWRHAGRRAHAVSGLELRIEPGERVLLLGASGAGKSTLLAALAGVLGDENDGAASGQLLVDGLAPGSARGRVGLVLQDPDSQVILARVGDDVAFGCENLGIPRDEIWRRVHESLDAVGLHLPLDRATSTLSGGQKQRLALAGVIAMHPGLLLLDEPTANLDPGGVSDVRDAVARTLDRTGSTLVVVEHRVDVWRSIVDRVIILEPGGAVIADGRPGDVLDRNGAALATSGVWIPEHPPAVPARNDRGGRGGGATLLSTESLGLARAKGEPLQRDIALELVAGQLLAITGPNGSGKSTLALALGGLLEPAEGRVIAAPALAAGLGPVPLRWKSRQLLTRIGSVFQDAEHQFLGRTVREELAIGPRAAGLSQAETESRVDELLERLRLSALARANPFTLSGGEKRRLSVGTAIATRPGVLVLDEPTFGQDSRTWSELVALLSELTGAGSAIAAVSHDAAFVDALANREFALERSPVAVNG